MPQGVQVRALPGALVSCQRSPGRQTGFVKQFGSRCLVAILATLVTALGNLRADASPGRAEFAAVLSRAEKGDPEAQHQVAFCYRYGWGVEPDLARFSHWLRKAAVAGHPQAQFSLSVYLRFGDAGDIAVDLKSAEAWLRKAAETGLDAAQYRLAEDLWDGQYMAKNRAEAMVWMRRAALGGNERAATWMGKRHEQGDGVAVDQVEALAWYLHAARCLKERRRRDPSGGYGSEGEPVVAEERLRKLLTHAEETKAHLRCEELWAERRIRIGETGGR